MKFSDRLFQTIAIAILALLITPQLQALEYEHIIALEQMSFEWKLDGNNIHIRLQAKTKGWIAIGFNPLDGMEGADFIIGFVRGGEVKIEDSYGIRKTEHIRDIMNQGKDDISGVSGSETGNKTTIAFTIPLSSGDKNDRVIDPALPTKVLLGFGPDRDNLTVKHKFRTALTVDLKTGCYQ